MRGLAVLGLLLLIATTTGSLGDAWAGSWAAAEGESLSATSVCAPVCPIPWTRHGPSAPATFVVSGTTVTWDPIDNDYHTASALDYCFDVDVDPGLVRPVTFTIRDGRVYAYDGHADEEHACTRAIALADGAFAIEYRCLFHSTLQKGTIVVLPDPAEAA